MNDVTCVRRLFSGERKTAVMFYRQHTPKLRRFIQHKIAVREDAEEVLQDTLFAFLEGLRDFRGQSSVKTYLYAICRHKIVDYYRKKKIKHLVFSQLPNLEKLMLPLVSPEDLFDTLQARERIRWVFDRIQPDYRQVLVLKYIEGISVDGIARRLAISFKSAESRLFRARKSFVEAFVNI